MSGCGTGCNWSRETRTEIIKPRQRRGSRAPVAGIEVVNSSLREEIYLLFCPLVFTKN
jgi:hypothetical protein